jgi:catabolite regulation protein CreA
MKYKNKYNDIFDYTTSDLESDQSENQLIQNQLSKQMTKNKQNLKNQGLHPDIHVKEYFLYHPEAEFRDLSIHIGFHVGFYIEKKYCNSKFNSNIRQKRPIYGTEYYYYKSDIVLMMIHCNMLKIESLNNPKVKGFLFICQVSKRKNFKDSLSNGISSERLNGQDKDGFSLKPISLQDLDSFGSERMLFHTEKLIFRKKKIFKMRPKRKRNYNPLSLYKWRFNKLNELSLHYSLETVADKSGKHEEFLSYLLDENVMVLETVAGQKYEVSLGKILGKENGKREMVFCLSRLTPSNMIDKNLYWLHKMKLPDEFKVKLFEDLKWSEIVWDSASVTVRDTTISQLDTFFFIKKNNLQINESEPEQ